MALAFEQQARESDKAFAAFSVYLSQGAERSLGKTAAKLGRSKGLMERWSTKFDWAGRVLAYNEHMALVEREGAEALVREKGVDLAKRYLELREEEWEERRRVVALAAEIRKRWMESQRCGTLEGYARLLELASKLGHSACEAEAGSGQRTEVTGAGGGPIRVEVELALKKIYGKPLAWEVQSEECKVKSEPRCLTEGNEGNEGNSRSAIADSRGRGPAVNGLTALPGEVKNELRCLTVVNEVNSAGVNAVNSTGVNAVNSACVNAVNEGQKHD